MATQKLGLGLVSPVADGGTAHSIDTDAAYTSGKLLSIGNNGTEKAGVGFDGAYHGPVRDKGGQVYDVMHPDFGAKGDGATDDAAAIVAALAACPAGGTVLFPQCSAYYSVPGVNAAGLIAVTKNVRLKGADRGVKIKFGTESPAGNSVVFAVTSGVDLVVEDLTVEGPDANNNKLIRAFGWASVDITGSMTFRRVTSTKFQEFAKLERSVSLDSAGLIFEDCDIANANDGAAAYVPVQVGTTGLTYGGYIKARRTKFTAGANAYCIYRAWQTALLVDDCDFASVDAGGSSWLLYAEGGATTAPTYDQIANSRFSGTNVTEAAIVTNKYAVEQITACKFTNGRAVQFRGHTTMANCHVSAGGLLSNRDDTLSGAVVTLENCRIDASLVGANYATTFMLRLINCIIDGVLAGEEQSAQINSTGTTLVVEGGEWRTGGTYQLRLDAATAVTLRRVRFYNAGGPTGAIRVYATASVLDLRTEDCWFEDPTKAFTFPSNGYTQRGLMPRRGTSAVAVASTDLIVLDFNYDTFHISGTDAISKIGFQNINYAGHPTFGMDARIALIFDAACAMGSTGNIVPSSTSARTAGTAATFVRDVTAGKWVEM